MFFVDCFTDLVLQASSASNQSRLLAATFKVLSEDLPSRLPSFPMIPSAQFPRTGGLQTALPLAQGRQSAPSVMIGQSWLVPSYMLRKRRLIGYERGRDLTSQGAWLRGSAFHPHPAAPCTEHSVSSHARVASCGSGPPVLQCPGKQPLSRGVLRTLREW